MEFVLLDGLKESFISDVPKTVKSESYRSLLDQQRLYTDIIHFVDLSKVVDQVCVTQKIQRRDIEILFFCCVCPSFLISGMFCFLSFPLISLSLL